MHKSYPADGVGNLAVLAASSLSLFDLRRFGQNLRHVGPCACDAAAVVIPARSERAKLSACLRAVFTAALWAPGAR